MRSRRALTVLLSLAAAVAAVPSTASAGGSESSPVVSELATFAAPGCTSGCGSGSTIGPDGALYVTDGPAGRVLRVDPDTGAMTTFAHGLPPAIPAVGIGGAMDVAFVDGTAYVLVTLVGPSSGSRTWSTASTGSGRTALRQRSRTSARGRSPIRPRRTSSSYSGVQYALEEFGGDFLVTDGHHNRVLRVTRGGDISQMIAFGNIVPTGLEVRDEHDLHGRGRPDPASPGERQGREVHADVGRDGRGRRGAV